MHSGNAINEGGIETKLPIELVLGLLYPPEDRAEVVVSGCVCLIPSHAPVHHNDSMFTHWVSMSADVYPLSGRGLGGMLCRCTGSELSSWIKPIPWQHFDNASCHPKRC